MQDNQDVVIETAEYAVVEFRPIPFSSILTSHAPTNRNL